MDNFLFSTGRGLPTKKVLSKDKKEKYHENIKTKIVEANLSIEDREFKPYIYSDKNKIIGIGKIEKGILTLRISNINLPLPLKLKIFGDIDLVWIFPEPNEIEFDLKGNRFFGKAIGSLRKDYIFIDLIENHNGTEQELEKRYFPYELSMK